MTARTGVEVTIDTRDARLDAYLATPSTPGPWPGVVVLQEAFGLTDDIKEHADHFAREGYLALAPDLYSWSVSVRCVVSAFRSMFAGKGHAFDDIAAARAYLAAHDDCSGRIGVIGFCMGGGFALLTAPRGWWDAASVNYGLVPKDAETVLAGACPIVASYGADDKGAKGMAARLESALTTLGVEHDIVEYPDTSHSFMNRHVGWQTAFDKVLGFGYREAASDDAWRRTLAFFETHLRSA